jgi:hypothetical protein
VNTAVIPLNPRKVLRIPDSLVCNDRTLITGRAILSRLKSIHGENFGSQEVAQFSRCIMNFHDVLMQLHNVFTFHILIENCNIERPVYTLLHKRKVEIDI